MNVYLDKFIKYSNLSDLFKSTKEEYKNNMNSVIDDEMNKITVSQIRKYANVNNFSNECSPFDLTEMIIKMYF